MTATPAGITYADYLDLDRLLKAQHPRSELHDEMLFIVIHQTKELWLKQLLHEVAQATALVRSDRFAEAYKALARVSRIQSVMTLSWDVLSTLTPVDYVAFRHVLGTSSGFQSAQFREFEYRLGMKDPAFLDQQEGGSAGRARLETAFAAPSLWDEANAALAREGFAIGDRAAIQASWLAVYRDSERWFGLYQLAEKLVDIDDALTQWRHKHLLTVERIIGFKTGHRRIGRRGLSDRDPGQARLPRTVVAADRAVSWKHLFARSLGAAPERLHMAAHSHHLWPDASLAGQRSCWDDGARLADRKWDRIMGEVWPEAQGACRRRAGQRGDRAGHRLRRQYPRPAHPSRRRLPAPRPKRTAAGAHQQRRIPQRAAPARPLGRERRGGR